MLRSYQPSTLLTEPPSGCSRTRSYMWIRFLAAWVHGTSDTCPVVLDIRCLPTTYSTHPPYTHLRLDQMLGSYRTIDSSSPAVSQHRSAYPYTATTAVQPFTRRAPRLSSEGRNEVPAFGSADLDHGQQRVATSVEPARYSTGCVMLCNLLKHYNCRPSLGRQTTWRGM